MSDACSELLGDVVGLALVDHAQLGAGEGAGVMRAWEGHHGDEGAVVELSHPVEGVVAGVDHPGFVVVGVVGGLVEEVGLEVEQVLLGSVDEVDEQ